MNTFYNINMKLPPIGIEVEVKNIYNKNITKDTLLKIEWIDQKVVYTWAKNNAHYLEWRQIKK